VTRGSDGYLRVTYDKLGLIGGFAVLAYPAEYGNSGVMK
jgi:hypothetical protein